MKGDTCAVGEAIGRYTRRSCGSYARGFVGASCKLIHREQSFAELLEPQHQVVMWIRHNFDR
jgi:hypothetical protein